MKKTKRLLLVLIVLLCGTLGMIACSKEAKDNTLDTPEVTNEAEASNDDNESTPSPEDSTADSTKNTQEQSDAQVTQPVDESNPVVEAEKGFYVDGTKLYDANGKEFVMRGINHAHTWFKNQKDTALEAIAATGANTVRIVLSDGQQWDKDDIDSVKQIIEKCKELKMIAVLEVHDITGNNEIEALNSTVDYWIGIKDALIGNEAYVIINIANEWYGEWKSETWTKGYQEAIPKLREAGLTHTFIVDSAGWGQYPKSIVEGGKAIFESDPLSNTMFSIHMYEYAGGDADIIKNNIDSVINQNLCVIVGEFGYKHTDGDVDEEYILSYSNEINIGYIGWSWKGNGGGVEYLDIATEWDGSVLSQDWGEILINSEYGIRNTSTICSVYQ